MRSLTVLFSLIVFATCCPAQITRAEFNTASFTKDIAREQHAELIDSISQFLLTSAATDFRTHGPSPVRFRNVRIGHVITTSGEKQYLLCGQFLPEKKEGKAKWTPFATIKTSGYEQWIGVQALGFCRNPSVIWEKVGDLSSSLQNRFDSLR